MVGLCLRLCRVFGRDKRDAAKDKEIAELVRLLKDIIPIAERELDGRLEADFLRKRLGVHRAYAGVA